MNTSTDGGPAFPVPPDHVVEMTNGRGFASTWGMGPERGMSLRDYFAAKALHGLMTEPSWNDGSHSIASCLNQALPESDIAAHYAKAAYMLADAMLAERAKVRT